MLGGGKSAAAYLLTKIKPTVIVIDVHWNKLFLFFIPTQTEKKKKRQVENFIECVDQLAVNEEIRLQ